MWVYPCGILFYVQVAIGGKLSFPSEVGYTSILDWIALKFFGISLPVMGSINPYVGVSLISEVPYARSFGRLFETVPFCPEDMISVGLSRNHLRNFGVTCRCKFSNLAKGLNDLFQSIRFPGMARVFEWFHLNQFVYPRVRKGSR